MPTANPPPLPFALPALAACLLGAALLHGAPAPAGAQIGTPPAPAASDSNPASSPAPASTPAPETPPRPTTPTGPAATAAQPTIRQCAELWNEMKAKNQTGKLTYRDFAQQCLAGTPGQASPAATAPGTAPATTAGHTPAPPPAAALLDEATEADRAALDRCNGEWQAYKARHNLTGAKPWHIFMARCLP